jgi:hypothetical protein
MFFGLLLAAAAALPVPCVARKDVFPNLKTIVVAGHSAGGQFVTRYEMPNQIHDKLGIPGWSRN